MEKFTKGEWVVSGMDIGIRDASDTQSYGMINIICSIDGYDFKDNENCNAHLIAAAPEMYAMLECHLAAWDNLYPSNVSDIDDMHKPEFEAVHKFINQTKELLSKARGE